MTSRTRRRPGRAMACGVSMSVALCCLAARVASGQQNLEVVEVVGPTPHGADIDADRLALNVQSATAEDLDAQRALDLADYMKRNLASVFVNEAQSNPLQPDVQYRGFVGSPLLGLPQGIAVYQDGMRLNEPFGDTVNWALIPEAAIDSIWLMPGSNPLFGLNALGGAISIRTKDGFTSDQRRLEAYTGSFGRSGVTYEQGGRSSDRFGYFFTGSYFAEDGWRRYSPSDALQAFGNATWQSGASLLRLNLAFAETTLIGNGPAPVELLALSRSEVFTRPDRTENELGSVNLVAEHSLSDTLTLTGNLSYRSSDIASLNGDDSDFEECDAVAPGFVCREDDGDETLVLDVAGNPIPAAGAVIGGTINRTRTDQDSVGFALQAAWDTSIGTKENTLVVGISYDDSDIGFSATTELGTLDSTRAVVSSGVFDGDSFTRLAAENSNRSIYLSNTITLSERMALTVSGRFNETDVVLHDRLGTALNGDHRFSRFNPSLGLTAVLGDRVAFYASVSTSNRAPSPVELTCADPDDPCRLPNAFLADPPLEQVVAETVEAGFRGERKGGRWHAGLFRTSNRDDILFISAGALTNQGYFDNVGATKRVGLEADISGRIGDSIGWFANATVLEATFRQSLRFPSANNPAASDGEVAVAARDRLPLVPDRLLKAGLSHDVTARFSWAIDMQLGSGFHMRGDEGNDLAQIGEFAVVNLRADYALGDYLTVFVNVDNVLDRDYETFGLFGEPDEVLGSAFQDSRFLSPAAPRAAWVGVRATF